MKLPHRVGQFGSNLDFSERYVGQGMLDKDGPPQKQSSAPPQQRYPVLTPPGLILVGPALNQVVGNQEAMQILAYPAPPASVTRLGTLLKEKLGVFVRQGTPPNVDCAMTELISGRRYYRCTRHVLNMQGMQGARTVVILMERTGSPEVTVQELCNGLHLSRREREAVGLLVGGLTSKEIAVEMGISPNTVKSFLRLVMTKAGVSTRTGLIGRVAGLVPRARAMSVAAGQGKSGGEAPFSRVV